MADEVTTAANDNLVRSLKEATRQATNRKAKIRDMTKAMETLTKENGELVKERDKLKSSSTPVEPGERERQLQEKLDAATTEIRTYKHRSAFDKVAKELKVRPDAMDDLFHLSGYKPDSEAPDPEKIKGLVAETVKSRSWLVQDEAAASQTTGADASKTGGDTTKAAPAGAGSHANGKPGPAGPGADRGQSPHEVDKSVPGRHPGLL